MVWGAVPGGPEGPAGSRQLRAEAHEAAHMADEETLRLAREMEDAGLKYRPPVLSPTVLVLVGVIVLIAIATLIF